MLLGKRPRPPMRRTTSMAGFAADLGATESSHPSDQDKVQQHRRDRQRTAKVAADGVATAWSARRQGPEPLESSHVAAASRSDFAALETATFLRACGLCQRRLGPGRDTFMYRGDIAFCSLECRQQQMNLDDRNEKCSLTSMKKDAPTAAPAASDASSSGEMVAAA